MAASFYLKLTFITVAMLVVGGLARLRGPSSGPLSITVVGEILRQPKRGSILGRFSSGARPGLHGSGLRQ